MKVVSEKEAEFIISTFHLHLPDYLAAFAAPYFNDHRQEKIGQKLLTGIRQLARKN